jgi:hypothetical protein
MWKALVGSAGALLVALCALASPSSAQSDSCRTFRDNLAAMERENARPAGWYKLNSYLRATYVETCSGKPRRAQEYWFRADGSPTGVRAEEPRPDGGAHTTTPAIAAACAPTGNFGVCVLVRGIEISCRPPGPGSERVCAMLLGDDNGVATAGGGAGDLPDLMVTIDGQTYRAGGKCASGLRMLEDELTATRRGLLTWSMQDCPDLLAAIERRAGVGRGDGERFWAVVQQLVRTGFAPRGQTARASPTASPGFQAMCQQARTHQKTCDERFARYRGELQSRGRDGVTRGQAVGFDECRTLYGHVVAMCDGGNVSAAPAPFSPPVRRAPPPVAQPPAGGTAKSMPPPQPAASQALQNMSTSCRAQLNALLEGTDRNDEAKASIAYDNLRKNCDASMRAMAQEANVGLPERRTGALTQRYFGDCLKSNSCGVAPSNPDQQARANQWGYEWSQIANLGFAFLNVAIGVAGMYTPAPGGQFSTMNPRARGTYGQGGPVYTAPRTGPSTITGGSR